MDRIVLASGNKGKVKEFSELLADVDIRVVPQSDFGVPDAEETGLTFVENSIIKARNAAAHTDLPAIADDSGLEVDYLNGAPGIYSARYAGGGGSAANNAKLLSALEGIEQNGRRARFRCVLVFLRHADDPTPLICQGTWEGEILTAAQGEAGFGYDPLFYVPAEHCSAAELSADRKNALSHRGQALRCLLAALRDAR